MFINGKENRVSPTCNVGTSISKDHDEQLNEVDNSGSVVHKIATLYAEKLMSDVCLIVGDVSYPAHRLILCASSDVFQVMLMNAQWSECQQKIVHLTEDPGCDVVFPQFLKYMYTGIMSVNCHNVLPVLCLADKYNVKDLHELCIQYMKDNVVVAGAKGHLVSWFQYTLQCGQTKVSNRCFEYMKWNFKQLPNSEDFGDFELDILVSLLHQNDLVVDNEFQLLKIVIKWLEIQNIKLCQKVDIPIEERASIFENFVIKTMSNIRFPMMSPRELAESMFNPFSHKFKEFFIGRMAIGMSYHAGQLDRVQEIFHSEKGQLLFTPRLYVGDTWGGATLVIKNYDLFEPYETAVIYFPSNANLAEHDGEQTFQWYVDVFPKGVWFRKSQLIVWHTTFEVPETVMKTVRVAVSCHDPPLSNDIRVKIGVIILGHVGNVEHVMVVKERIFHFSRTNRVLNIDDVVPFSELNPLPGTKSTNHGYLVGSDHNVLKMHIVVMPLDQFCILQT